MAFIRWIQSNVRGASRVPCHHRHATCSPIHRQCVLLTAAETAAELKAAMQHPYNREGELRKDIREKNDQFFLAMG